MHRLVIFTNSPTWVPAILIRGTLAGLAAREDLEVAAVCVPESQHYAVTFCRYLAYRIYRRIQSLFDPALRRCQGLPLPINLNRLARYFQFKVLVPPGGDINHPDFIARLRKENQPMIALSFYCLQKFSPDLLAVFRDAVNYHDSLLPSYRGRRATAWSVYHGEKETGFTFHRMTKEFDDGAILVQRTIPVVLDQSTFDLELGKAIMAARFIPHVIDMVVDGSPGIVQRGESSYFSMENYLAVTRIHDPLSLSSLELLRRLRVFGGLWIRINDVWYMVTKIRQVPDQPGKCGRACFRSSDGIMMKAVLFGHFPYPIYLALQWCRKWFPRKVIA